MIKRRNGAFVETALEAGAAYDDAGRAEAGMGVAAGDYDGDGDEDLIVTNLMGETLTLYQNNGRAEFVDVTIAAKLATPSDQTRLGSLPSTWVKVRQQD